MIACSEPLREYSFEGGSRETRPTDPVARLPEYPRSVQYPFGVAKAYTVIGKSLYGRILQLVCSAFSLRRKRCARQWVSSCFFFPSTSFRTKCTLSRDLFSR